MRWSTNALGLAWGVEILLATASGVQETIAAEPPNTDHGICTAYLKPGLTVVQWGLSAESCLNYCRSNGFSRSRLAKDCLFDPNDEAWESAPVAPEPALDSKPEGGNGSAQ